MKTINPALIVESLLEGVDHIDDLLKDAVEERVQQYEKDDEREDWQRVLANWLIARNVVMNSVGKLMDLVDTANRRDLKHMALEFQRIANTL
jgi:hypothetical protein